MYKKFLDLGKQPLANKFLTKAEISKKEDFYNLSIGHITPIFTYLRSSLKSSLRKPPN